MIKVAELINGKIICGEFNDNNWNQVLFIQLVPQGGGKAGINFAPVIQFGDLDKAIKIEEDNIIYSYIPDPKFVELYQQNLLNLRALRSGIVMPDSPNN